MKIAYIIESAGQIFEGNHIERETVAAYRDGHTMWDGTRRDVRWSYTTTNGGVIVSSKRSDLAKKIKRHLMRKKGPLS